MKRVLVFGVFDRLHKGHEFFLEKAREFGDELTVCLAQDEMVMALKGHAPKQPFTDREKALKSFKSVDQVLVGDSSLGGYSCLKNANPDVVALGYDQSALKEDLEKWIRSEKRHIELVQIDSHKPEMYKSSLL